MTTAPEWLDGAIRVPSDRGGTMAGGPPRFVWHTFEADPARLSAVNGAKILIRQGTEVHFVLNPITGELAQLLPASASARGLVNRSGGVETNRMGSRCLQVEVIGFASQPFTSRLTPAGRAGLARLIRFGRLHGIPDVWPAGPPPVYPGGFSVRSCGTWTGHAGHFGHSQVPENDHGDPGAIDATALLASAPLPAPVTAQQAPAGAARKNIGADMIIIFTPSNGAFLLTSIGRRPLDAGLATRMRAAGFPSVNLGAVDTTNLTAVVDAIVTEAEQETAKLDDDPAPAQP